MSKHHNQKAGKTSEKGDKPLSKNSSCKNGSTKSETLCSKEQEVQHHFHWDLIEGAIIIGPHQHAQLKPITEFPNVKRMVTLNNAPYEKHPEECALCFYTKDTVIERIWNNRQRYVSVLKRFPLIIGLDFSILCNMYYPQQSYNCWRNYAMTYWLQKNFSVVVPNVGYGDSDTFPWVLDGLPENSWLAITTQGCLDSYVLKRMLLNGLHEIKTEAPYRVNCVWKISGSMEKTVFYTNKSLSFLSRNEMGGQQRWEEVKVVILQSRLIIKILVEEK